MYLYSNRFLCFPEHSFSIAFTFKYVKYFRNDHNYIDNYIDEYEQDTAKMFNRIKTSTKQNKTNTEETMKIQNQIQSSGYVDIMVSDILNTF